ncbi:MAG: acetate--CoA ligase family protein [Desulfatibacillaceae bacterium]
MDSIEDSPLYRIANPGSIAFFGASNSFASMGTSCLSSLLSMGYEGRVYPVHPSEETVQGLSAFASVEEIPEVPDLAIFVLPTKIVCEALEQCGKKGIRHAIVVTAGFREVGGEGHERERELVEVADRYGIRFLGPNCIGVTNPHVKLNTTFMESPARPGYVGLASQSGSFVTQLFDYLDARALGFSAAFSVGNAANVDLVDCMEYLGRCPNTKVIGLYIEGIARGRAFVEAARRITPRKPVVALYVGGSETGKRAGMSHTGTMAGPDRLYDGIFRQSGIVRAHTLTELFDFCWVLGGLPGPAGNRVVVQTHSGGPGATAADSCGRAGLEVPPLTETTLSRLAEYIPHTGSKNNPVDITFSKNPQDYFSAVPEILAGDANADMFMSYYLVPDNMVKRPLMRMGVPEEEAGRKAAEWLVQQADALAGIMKKVGKPFVGYTYRDLWECFPSEMVKRGIPMFSDPDRAARALAAMVRYMRMADRIDGQDGAAAKQDQQVGEAAS